MSKIVLEGRVALLPLQLGVYLTWRKDSSDLGEGQGHTKTSGFKRSSCWFWCSKTLFCEAIWSVSKVVNGQDLAGLGTASQNAELPSEDEVHATQGGHDAVLGLSLASLPQAW